MATAGRKPTKPALRPGGDGIMFGEEVHRLRRERGLSLDGLSEASGLSRATLSHAERDLYAPSGRTVDALVEVLAPPERRDRLATLAAETYRRLETDLDGLDRRRIELLVMFRRRLQWLSNEQLETIRSAVESTG